MREPGFYWVKYCDKWVVAECTKWWPTISDGSYEHRWFIPGFKKGRRDNDMEAIDECRIVRDENKLVNHRDKEIERRCNAIIKLLKNS